MINQGEAHSVEPSGLPKYIPIRKLSFGTSLPAAPGNGIFLDYPMHQRGVDPLALRGLEDVQAVLAVSDQPSFVGPPTRPYLPRHSC